MATITKINGALGAVVPISESPVDSEIVKKLSSITDEIEKSVNGYSAPSDPDLSNISKPTVSISTLPQYKNSISLRGKANLIVSAKHIFDILSQNLNFGAELGSWQGQWGMNDNAFLVQDGILSPYKYDIRLGQDFSEDQNENSGIEIINIVLSGSFEVKKPVANPIQVSETDVVLKLERKKGEDLASVTGSGENRYGLFKLFGEYRTSDNSLNCYREYLRQGIGGSRKPKRVAAKRSRPGSTPGSQDLKKRQSKTPKHLKDSLNMKTFKPPKSTVSVKGSSKNDISALKDMVMKLISDDREKFFCQPVDPVRLNLPDYSTVIKSPMDLGTVLNNLNSHSYVDIEEGVKDIRLVFQNAMQYNPPKHPVHSIASMHLKHFERDLKKFLKDKEKKSKAVEKKKLSKAKSKQKSSYGVPSAGSNAQVNQIFADQKKKFMKSKKKLMDMFNSSGEESSGESETDEQLNVKKKRKKGKNELEYMKNMMAMMNNQMEMMQEMHKNSMQEVTRLQQELNGSKQNSMMHLENIQNPSQGYNQAPAQFIPPGMAYEQPTSFGGSTSQQTKKKDVKPLTLSQMKQLGDDINRLPVEDIAGLISLLQESGADLGEGEEVELDLENLSPEVCRQAQKYVSKKLAKAKSAATIGDLKFDES